MPNLQSIVPASESTWLEIVVSREPGTTSQSIPCQAAVHVHSLAHSALRLRVVQCTLHSPLTPVAATRICGAITKRFIIVIWILCFKFVFFFYQKHCKGITVARTKRPDVVGRRRNCPKGESLDFSLFNASRTASKEEKQQQQQQQLYYTQYYVLTSTASFSANDDGDRTDAQLTIYKADVKQIRRTSH
ncbi:hypothetical protein VTO42DRAFT_4089 [Malbranchea cinnamomea]